MTIKSAINPSDAGNYDLYALRPYSETKLNSTPMTHKEVCEFKSRFSPYKDTILQIKEVKE